MRFPKKPSKRVRKWRITIPLVPPSYNDFKDWHWGRWTKLKAAWYPVVEKACEAVYFKKIPTPCKVSVTVYKRNPGRGDVCNLLTAVDKLALDALTLPRGKKLRGLGYLPDDDFDHLRAATITMKMATDKEKTVMEFTKVKK